MPSPSRHPQLTHSCPHVPRPHLCSHEGEEDPPPFEMGAPPAPSHCPVLLSGSDEPSEGLGLSPGRQITRCRCSVLSPQTHLAWRFVLLFIAALLWSSSCLLVTELESAGKGTSGSPAANGKEKPRQEEHHRDAPSPRDMERCSHLIPEHPRQPFCSIHCLPNTSKNDMNHLA